MKKQFAPHARWKTYCRTDSTIRNFASAELTAKREARNPNVRAGLRNAI